ncbi:hypothetical protein ACS4RR_006180 [Rhizobium sp. Z1P35]
MADRRENPLARWLLDSDLPHHVIIWWGNYQSGESAYTSRERGDVITSAVALDQTSKSYAASIEWDDYCLLLQQPRSCPPIQGPLERPIYRHERHRLG